MAHPSGWHPSGWTGWGAGAGSRTSPPGLSASTAASSSNTGARSGANAQASAGPSSSYTGAAPFLAARSGANAQASAGPSSSYTGAAPFLAARSGASAHASAGPSSSYTGTAAFLAARSGASAPSVSSASVPRFFSDAHSTPGEQRQAALRAHGRGSLAQPPRSAPIYPTTALFTGTAAAHDCSQTSSQTASQVQVRDPMATLRTLVHRKPQPDDILEVFRHIERAGPPAGITRSMFTGLTKQVRDKWGPTSWTRSVMVQHGQVLMRFPERLEPEPEPEPQPQPAPRTSYTTDGRGRVGNGSASGSQESVSSSANGEDLDDEAEARREMEAAMEQVNRLSQIRELQRQNIRDGIGDAEGTDERVVAMYADLIDTAGLTYQGVVQHEKVAKGLSKTQLDRIQAKRNPTTIDCPLCLEPMPAGLRVATLPCCGVFLCNHASQHGIHYFDSTRTLTCNAAVYNTGNLFHFSTIRPHERWTADPDQTACCGIENCLEQVGSCPLCRQDLGQML